MKTLKLIFALCVITASSYSHGAFAESGKCTYSLDPNSVVVGFTAYKTTDKVGVNGVFKKIDLHGKKDADSLSALIQGLHVLVDSKSIDTANPVRNKTVVDYFFSKLKPAISGHVTHFSEKDHSFILSLDLNGVRKDVPMTYTVTADKDFSATGGFSILDFSGDDALKSIHEKCYELHKGKDGVSKTWPDVTLNLKGTINPVCK